MKKLIVFIFLIAIICGINLSITQNLSIDKLFKTGEVEIYLPEKSGLYNVNKIDNGNGEIIFCNIQQFEELKNKLSNISGYTIKLQNTSFNDVVDILKPMYVDSFNNSYYGYVNNLSKSVVTQDKNYNFQCVEKQNKVLIGVPILLGSY